MIRTESQNRNLWALILRIFPCVTVIFYFSSSLLAQQELPYSEEITVISPYTPTIAKAFKMNISPRIEAQNLQKPELSYSIQDRLMQTPLIPNPSNPSQS